MSAAYWQQWDRAEIMSMQGVEIDEIHLEEYEEEVHPDLQDFDDNGCGCSGGCSYCLMTEW